MPLFSPTGSLLSPLHFEHDAAWVGEALSGFAENSGSTDERPSHLQIPDLDLVVRDLAPGSPSPNGLLGASSSAAPSGEKVPEHLFSSALAFLVTVSTLYFPSAFVR